MSIINLNNIDNCWYLINKIDYYGSNPIYIKGFNTNNNSYNDDNFMILRPSIYDKYIFKLTGGYYINGSSDNSYYYLDTLKCVNLANSTTYDYNCIVNKNNNNYRLIIKKNDISNAIYIGDPYINSIGAASSYKVKTNSKIYYYYSLNDNSYRFQKSGENSYIDENTEFDIDQNKIYNGINNDNTISQYYKVTKLRKNGIIDNKDLKSFGGAQLYFNLIDVIHNSNEYTKDIKETEERNNNVNNANDLRTNSDYYLTTSSGIYQVERSVMTYKEINIDQGSVILSTINKKIDAGKIIEGGIVNGDPNTLVITKVHNSNNDLENNQFVNTYIKIEDDDNGTKIINLIKLSDEDIDNLNLSSRVSESINEYTTARDEAKLRLINADLNAVAEDIYGDEVFGISYNSSGITSVEEFVENLENQGGMGTVNMNKILGCPNQFLPLTDPRLVYNKNSGSATLSTTSTLSIGRIYGEKIFSNIPILHITPGVPSFLAKFNQGFVKSFLNTILMNGIEGNQELENLVNNNSGRYYSLKFEYQQYYSYVNAMLRSAASFLNIENEKLYGTELGNYNWLSDGRNLYEEETSTQNNESSGNWFADSWNWLVDRLGDGWNTVSGFFIGATGNLHDQTMGGFSGTVMFYADCGNQVDDSFSNSTTQSQLVSSINSISDLGRELAFITGTADSIMATNSLTAILDGGMNSLTEVSNFTDLALGKNNLISNIVNKAKTVLSGGRLLFPEIWTDSSFSRSYSCRMKLISPSGDKLSVYLNILVPIYHLLALVLPRQTKGNPEGYYSPFLVRAYSQGLFNIDMGIITDMNITKGAEAEWTVDGIPTVAEVSFTIKDLYEGLSMSPMDETIGSLMPLPLTEGILSNTAELDYIANSCGVNINEQHALKLVKLAWILNFGNGDLKKKFQDTGVSIQAGVAQYFANRRQNIFGGLLRSM